MEAKYINPLSRQGTRRWENEEREGRKTEKHSGGQRREGGEGGREDSEGRESRGGRRSGQRETVSMAMGTTWTPANSEVIMLSEHIPDADRHEIKIWIFSP